MPPLATELIWVVAALFIVGVILWVLNQIPNVDPTIKLIARVIIVAALSIWLIYFLATMLTSLPALRR